MMDERTYAPPEAAETRLIPTELSSQGDLQQFWLAFRRNNGLQLEDADREERAAALQARETLNELGKSEEPVYFFGIKKDGKVVATVRLQTWEDNDDVKRGYFSLLTVDPELRGKKVAQSLRDVCVDVSRREGCWYLNAHVFSENPIGLVTELNDGFAVVDFDFQDDTQTAGGFIIRKDLANEAPYDRSRGPVGELQEVALTDLATIKELLDTGWLGIDMKNLGNPKDNDPKQWQL